MSEVLSQDEINQLLAAINAGDTGYGFENIEAFEKYLTGRKFQPEEPYGICAKDISICRFYDFRNNENLLADIKKKNEEQGFGNFKIPNTNIMLINYSYCPKCKTIFSFKEITDYYMHPKPDASYKTTAYQYRNDTRVLCNNCDTYFLPSLVISDGMPKNEVQFLCRVQTIEAIEGYMLSKNTKVLTKKKTNIVNKGKLRVVKNDVSIMDLEKKPTLIANLIQYTPINLMMNFIDGTNIEKGDLLYGGWADCRAKDEFSFLTPSV